MANTTLFFDLDGTLCHPTIPFARIFTTTCAPLVEGLADAPVAALQDAWNDALLKPGHSTMPGCLAQACATAGILATERLIEQCASALTVEWAAAQRLDTGVAETLAYLGRKYPLGLITNGPSDGQRAVITTLDLDSTFRWRIVSGDANVGVRKPDMGIFQRALALAGSAPRDAWYIGDSLANDIAGASRAGWRTCWIASPDAPITAGSLEPDARIARLDELIQMLETCA